MAWRDFQSLSTLSRSGGGDWPSEWPTLPDKWPHVKTDRWIPARAGPCVIVCARSQGEQSRIVSFETAEQAREADRVLYDRPCGPGCLREHFRVWCTPGELHVERGIHDPAPMPADLGAALRAAGYHPPVGVKINGTSEVVRPADCPHPTRLNEPLWRAQ
jgi:hypothetical protein